MTTYSIDRLLDRAVAAPFYRRHAGLFLFLFLVLFGIQPTFKNAIDTHYRLMLGVLTSIRFYGLAVGVWLLYAAKIIFYFSGSVVKKPAFDFLYTLNALPPVKRGLHLIKLAAALLLPVLGYGGIICLIAITKQYYVSGVLVLATLLLLVLSTASLFFLLLRRGKGGQQVSVFLRLNLPGNLAVFLSRSLFSTQFPALLIVKLLSFLCLYSFTLTDVTVFEDRILWLLYLISLIGHSIIIFRSFHFLEKELRFYRNLPLSPVFILLSLLVVYTILLLPEAWALRAVVTVRSDVYTYLSMLLTGPAMLLLFHALLLTEDMKMEDFLKLLSGIGLVSLFASFSSWRWILPAACFIAAITIFFISFYSYEKNTAVEGLE